MKKFIKITLAFIILLLTILYTKAFAATENLKPVSVEVTAPEAGIYGEGQEITIKCTFDKAIKGKLPNYRIYFFDSGKETEYIELETQELTDFSTEAIYEYTIKSGDNGCLKHYGFKIDYNSILEDENGNQFNVTDNNVMWDETIFADTTIEWTDFSNVKIEPEIVMMGYYKNFDLKFESCEWKKESEYYMHISHDGTEKITIKNPNEVKNAEFWKQFIVGNDNKFDGSSLKEIFVESGDVFFTICEIDSNTKVPKIVLKSKKVDKLDSLPLGRRVKGSFSDDNTKSICYEMHSANQQNINYKIGKVADYNLLKSLKDGQYSALQELMEYAKKADSIGSGTVKLGDDNTITDKLNLVNDEYYYVYLQVDTVNGKYILIEDVMLYQALVSDSLGKNLYSMDDEKFEWKLEEPAPEGVPNPTPTPDPTPTPKPDKKDETTSEKDIPQAGLEKTIIIFLIAITVASVIALSKYKKYRDI